LRVEIADIDKRGKISLVLVAEDAGEAGDGDAATPAPETSPTEADAAAATS
jgi:polyribonucleotide nucleotidyltransferase